MSNIVKSTLPNGVRVLVESVDHVQSAAIGLWCVTGSSHERDTELGVSHLIEHMLFKGTETRTAKQIAEAIEGRGGMLNAFTDKEMTCYYCRVLAADIGIGVEVLGDILTHSLVDHQELALEKDVVIDEIKRSEDEPSEFVHDLHLQARWGSHPLSRPVIGTPESVSALDRANVQAYMARRYCGPQIVVAATGKVDGDEFLAMVDAQLGGLSSSDDKLALPDPVASPADQYKGKDVEQIHFCIGTDGCALGDDRIYVLSVLDAALGGGMSSRLFQEIREKRGLAYAVGSYGLSFSVGGAYTVYGGTSPDKWPEVRGLVLAEFDKVSRNGLEEDELERTKRLLGGNMVLALEGMSSRMMRMSRNEIHYRREIPVEESLAKIEAVTNAQIADYASQIFEPDRLSVTVIGPHTEAA